jgi:hypothetical protein
MTASGARAMRGETMLARLAAAALVASAAAILLSLQLLRVPAAPAHVFDEGAAASLEGLAAATRL